MSASRSSARPCEVASTTAYSFPASTMSASRRCTSGASGVLIRVALAVAVLPTRVSTVLIRPADSPCASSAAWMSSVVVVLPFVPVTPTTVSRSDGYPSCAAAIDDSARRAEGTSTTGAPSARSVSPRPCSATSAAAPAATAAAAKSCPSARRPGMQTKRSPGSTSRESCCTRSIAGSEARSASSGSPSRQSPRALIEAPSAGVCARSAVDYRAVGLPPRPPSGNEVPR